MNEFTLDDLIDQLEILRKHAGVGRYKMDIDTFSIKINHERMTIETSDIDPCELQHCHDKIDELEDEIYDLEREIINQETKLDKSRIEVLDLKHRLEGLEK